MKKHILNISTIDILGAGSAAYRFHRLFKENGDESVLLVLDKYLKDKDVIGFRNKSKLLYRIIYRVLEKLKYLTANHNKINPVPKYLFQNSNESQLPLDTKKIILKLPFKPDAIFIYWISGFINTKNIKEIIEITGAPVFWILTDMGPLTGGCHYAWDCLGYTKDCGNCKALVKEKDTNKQIAFKNLEFKKKQLLNELLTFITPTSILEAQFLKSSFNQLKYYKIFLPIDNEIFKPADKKLAKRYFSIDENIKVVFMGSSDFSDERKGMNYLSDSLKILKSEFQIKGNELLLLIAGKNIKNFFKNLPFNYKYVGVLSTDEALCKAYSAAEIFACPSIEDSGPMMINESILCGTPVVAFKNVGVANDLIKTGETGYLANKKDIRNFAYGIKYILELEEQEYNKMSSKCRETGLNLCDPNKIRKELIELINN